MLGIAIFIIAVILVSNTIRLIIHAQQKTIETLHLLGATNNFIRFPFVVEGVVQGLIGAGFSLLILFVKSLVIRVLTSSNDFTPGGEIESRVATI